MQKAITPGADTKKPVCKTRDVPRKNSLLNRVVHCSMHALTIPSVAPIEGANQNIVETGLSNPIFLFFRSTCVRLHRRPPSALAVSTRIKPCKTNSASVATIRSTPVKINKITATSRQEKVSRRNRNANSNTNISDDDLHIAVGECHKHKLYRCGPQEREIHCKKIE